MPSKCVLWGFPRGVGASVQNVFPGLLQLDDGVPELVDVGSWELFDFLAALDEHKGGHRVDVVLGRNVLAFVDIDL